jgi:GTPase involved in cell partitioning and DNA repair
MIIKEVQKQFSKMEYDIEDIVEDKIGNQKNNQLMIVKKDITNQLVPILNTQISQVIRKQVAPEINKINRIIDNKLLDEQEVNHQYRQMVMSQHSGKNMITRGDKKEEFQRSTFAFNDYD